MWRSLHHTKPLFCQQASSHTGANLRCPHSNFHSQRSSIVFSSSLSISTTKLSSSPSSASSLPSHIFLALSGCPLICLLASNIKKIKYKVKWAHLFKQFFSLILFLCGFLVLVCLKRGPKVWRFPSCRQRENLMVVYSGASAVPSHLFQSLMRRRGIYCNVRRINSAYLFRLSLCWDHRGTLTFSHKP